MTSEQTNNQVFEKECSHSHQEEVQITPVEMLHVKIRTVCEGVAADDVGTGRDVALDKI